MNSGGRLTAAYLGRWQQEADAMRARADGLLPLEGVTAEAQDFTRAANGLTALLREVRESWDDAAEWELECVEHRTNAERLQQKLDGVEENRDAILLSSLERKEQLLAIDAACFVVCPDNALGVQHHDDIERFICEGENGLLIEADTPVQVIEQMSARWAEMQERAERAESQLAALVALSVPKGGAQG